VIRATDPPRLSGRGGVPPNSTAFEQSSAFTDLAEPTKRDYRRIIRAIEKNFGRLPIAGLNDRRARGIFREWRDDLAIRSRRQADYHMQVLARRRR
jgi:hypothetical protein